MIHEEELKRAMAHAEHARTKKATIVAKLIRSINEAEGMVAQIGEQDQNESKKLIETLKENADLKMRVAAVKKELMDQTSKAHRLEEELRLQVQKYQEAIQTRTVVNNVYNRYEAAEYDDGTAHQDTKRKQQKEEERRIPMSTVLSFSTSRTSVEQIQTLVDLLYFAIDNRTPKEEKAIKQMLTDFLNPRRPQMNVKDSTQNFYVK